MINTFSIKHGLYILDMKENKRILNENDVLKIDVQSTRNEIRLLIHSISNCFIIKNIYIINSVPANLLRQVRFITPIF